MTPTLAVAIMHAPWKHERRAWVADTQRRLQPHPVHVVADTRHEGCWPTARNAWLYLATTGATHALLLQDDVRPVDDFFVRVAPALEAVPNRALSIFTDNKFAPEAVAQGSAWYAAQAGVTAQALILPRAWITPWLRWCADAIRPEYPHDDGRLRLFIAAHHGHIWVCSRGLASHAGAHGSLLNHRFTHPGYIAPPDVDWTQGATDPPKGGQRFGTPGESWREARCRPVRLADADSGWRPADVTPGAAW